MNQYPGSEVRRLAIGASMLALCAVTCVPAAAQRNRGSEGGSRSSSSSSSSRSSSRSSSGSTSSRSNNSSGSSRSRGSDSSSSSRRSSGSSPSSSSGSSGRSWSRRNDENRSRSDNRRTSDSTSSSGSERRNRDSSQTNSRTTSSGDNTTGIDFARNRKRDRDGDRKRDRDRDKDRDRDRDRNLARRFGNSERDRRREDRWRQECERGRRTYPTRIFVASNYGNYNYGSSAYEQGYRDGLYTGASDARRGETYDPERSHFYRNGRGGFLSIFGSPASYSFAYRDGFMRGYEEGYQNWQSYFISDRFRR